MKKITIIVVLVLIKGNVAMSNPKSEVEELMNDGIIFGEQLLEKYGEFFPFGRAMKPDGEIVSVAGYDGDDQPPSQDVINLLKDGYRLAAKNGDYKATALFYDVRVIPPNSENKTDAIAAALDHKGNYSVVVYFPYKLVNSNVEFGEIFAEQGLNDVFVH